MAKTLRLLPQNLNSYETAHQLLSGSPYYSDDMWLYAARNDQLENYMTALVNDVDISKETLLKDYNYQFGDAETKLAALQNELFADKTTLKTRERIKVDEAGNPILKNGQYQWETYETSDYDYFKNIIKTNNDKLYEDYLKAQEIERKESMNFWAKLGTTVVSVPLEAVEGITSFIDDTTALLYATGEWIGSGFEKGSFVESIASDDARLFENLGFQDWLIDFESRYTWMREIDGSYTSFGQIAGGVANSLGYMLPSMLLTKSVGAVASKAGSAAIAKAGSIASQSLFYAGMTSGNIKDMYETFAHQGVSVSSSKLVFNSALKSAAQWGIEVGLGKILGSTSLDNLVFGRQISKGVGKDLTSAALKRVGKDFVQEGLEEVLQDTSDFLINKGFSWFIDEDFEHVAEWSLENMAYAFVVGGLASFAGSARNILRTKRVSTGDILVDDTGEIRYDKKGKPVEQKLSKIASWEYGLNMDSFIQNFNEIKREGDRLARLEAQGRITKDSYDFKAYETALKEMYASMRLISSVYNTIGEERFKNADQILTKITERIRSGKWSEKDQFKHVRIAAENIVKQVFGSDDNLDLRGANMLNAMERIEKAKLEKVLKEYERNEDGNIEFSDETKEGIEGIVAKDKKIRKVVITQDGERPLIVEDVLFAPLEIARTAKGDMIYDTIAEQKLVEDTVAGKYKISLDIVLKTYKEVSGLDNATMDEAIYNLYFNDSFFRIMLQNANRDVYQFLSSLLTIEKNLIPKDFRDETYKSKLKLVTTWMLNALEEYCINQQNAEIELDVFDQARIKRIRAMRWCKDLYIRVITGDAEGNAKYSEQDLTVLSNRINGLKLSKAKKERLYKQLQSNSPITRMSAINQIDREYDGVFRTPYNGEIYMPTNSLANQIFNNYLISAGLTIQTVLEQDTLSNDELKAIEGTYGQVNPDTILQYRNEQLSVTCNGRYRFSAIKRDGLWRASIFTADGKQVGYSAYGDNIDKITSGENIDERTFIAKGKRNNAEIRKLLRADIDIATASYLSIDDVINNPEYLTDDIQNAIRATYGDLSPDSAFFYMRKYFLDKFKNVTVIVMQDGTYAFGDVNPMLSVLKKGTLEIDEHTKISDLINPKYLLGRAKYLKIELTDDPNVIAQYRYLTKAKVKNVNVSVPDNTLILNRNVLRDDPNLARFAFLHEFQHCIQTETKMNLGLDNGWLFKIPKTLRDKIVADVKQHKPELFEGITDKKQIRQIVNDFVYHTTGESTAYGMDASEKVDFYPTLVTPSAGKLMVTLPWGSRYDLLSNYVSITAKSAIYDKKYAEIRKIINESLLDYSSDAVRKGFLMPDGSIKFFIEPNLEIDNMASIFTLNADTHQSAAASLVNSTRGDYMMAMSYLFDALHITNTAYVKNNVTGAYEPKYAYNKGNGYTVVIDRDVNYEQVDRLKSFINKARKDGHKVALVNGDGMVYVSTEDITKYDTAEDLYKLFLKKYNATPQERTFVTEFSGQKYDKFLAILDDNTRLLHKHHMTSVLDTSFFKGILNSEYNPMKSDYSYYYDDSSTDVDDVVMTPDGKLFPDVYISKDGTYYPGFYKNIKQDVVDAETFNDILSDRRFKGLDKNDLKLFAKSLACFDVYRSSHRLFVYVMKIWPGIHTTYNQLVNIEKMCVSAADFINYQGSNLEYTFLKASVIAKDHISLVDQTTGEVYNYYPSDKINNVYNANDVYNVNDDGNAYFKILGEMATDFQGRLTSSLSDAGFQEYQTDVLDVVDTEQIAKFSKGEYTESQIAAKEGAYDDMVSFAEDEEYEDEISMDWGDLGSMGFAETKDVEKTSASKKRADAKKAFDGKIKSNTEKSKRKRITVEGAKGNNLMYFKEKYKQVQIDSRLYDFIKATTGKRGIDTWIMERINGKLKGTLSMSDLMYYFSTSEKINDKTFQLLNTHIFKNKFITSFDELNTYVQERSAEYYAVRALLSQTTWGKTLLDLDRIISDEQFEQIKDMLLKDKSVTKTGRTIQDVYNSIVSNYYSFKKATLNINEGYLRRLWMRKYDGTIQIGGYISSLGRWAAILNWAVAHGDVSEGAKSLNQSIADDIELSDTLRDDSALEAFDALFDEVDKNELAEEMINMLMPNVIRKLRKEVSSAKEFSDKVKSELEHYKEKYANMSEERLKSLYDRLVIAEEEQAKRYKEKYGDKGLSILAAEEEMLREEMKTLLSYIDESSVTSGRPYVSRSKSKLYTIKKLLSESDKKRFLKVNSDIVDENLKLKREAYLTNPDEKNTKKLVYKSADELKALEERISKLRSEIDTGAYKSKKAMELKDSYERKIAKLEKRLADALTAKSKTPIVVEIDTTTLHIDADREMPSTLRRLLDTEFTQVAKSKTKYLTNDTDYHIRMNMETFIKKHDAFLATFTQEDVEEIIDFYEHSDVLGLTGANASQRYSAVRIYMLTFILKGNRLGQFTLDDTRREKVENMLESIVSKAGMELAAWRKAKKELDPEKVLVQSLAKSNNLEFSEESIQELVQATKALQSAKVGSKDWENASRKVVEAKQKMYTQGVTTLKGRPRSIWDKILKFEQVAMLSGPGTWLRNLTSNVTITASNKLLDKIIAKLPSKKGLKVEQYKIAGTVISSDVKKFIDETFKTKLAGSDYTMLDLISDGLNKYDTRKFNKNDALDNLTIQIRNAIIASIYGDVHSNKLGKKDLQNWYDKVSSFVFKMLSDKKFVDSAALSYFGKILTETNADLSKGIADNTIMKYLCDAFVLASHDYMHKTNIFTSLDEVVRNTSKPVYFLYKQFMPFAATGWNWFVEGLRYTPLGLAQSIIKLAKLETTIERIEDSLQKGNKVPDSRFAEYVTKRNIGKGIIGTVGWIIGALLFTFGWARIDEEDDKYKLFVADNIAIDISDIFGTQGVFMGITSMKFFQELFKKDGDWDGVKTAMATTLDYMLMDSIFNDLFNMTRFDASVGDWLLYAPTKILNMLVPQFMKTLSDVAYTYEVEFSEGTLGNIERLAVNAIPFLAYAFPKHHDPYTGEVQTTYHAQFVTDLANKLLPFKIYPYKVSDAEKEALRLGIHKTSLTGNYSVSGKEVKLSTKDIELLNTFYGKLNKKSLEQLFGNKMKYRVWNEDKNKYEEKLYGSMTEKQKAAVIERIMSNNGGYAKVYILTQNGYKYYASEAEYKTFKSLGISCYKATDKKKGFIKS